MRSGTAPTRRGFTLIELLVVVVIIGILVTIAVPYMMQARVKARETQVAANLSEIHNALEAFGVDNSGNYPFRVRWFNDDAVDDADFDPYVARGDDQGANSDDRVPNWFSLGLFGGVRVVTDTFEDNTFMPRFDEATPPPWIGMREHKVVQPWQVDANTELEHVYFYHEFNQYSDPLVALGYLDAYPQNPFLKRPMGCILWNYGRTSAGLIDKTIPDSRTITTPGDFVYTFFYETDGTNIFDPEGVVEAKRSYTVASNSTPHEGVYYLDVIDSYHLWAYGNLVLSGGRYIAYPNNFLNLTVRGKREASKDWDNSGAADTRSDYSGKDMYEMGMVAYFKTTSTSSLATDAQGNRVEF